MHDYVRACASMHKLYISYIVHVILYTVAIRGRPLRRTRAYCNILERNRAYSSVWASTAGVQSLIASAMGIMLYSSLRVTQDLYHQP